MAKIENLISEISDPRLQKEIANEVAILKKHKKFGLVFEEHIPETIQLPNLSIKKGSYVVKFEDTNKKVFIVKEILDSKLVKIIEKNNDSDDEIIEKKRLVVVKRFGDPIYPALIPVESLIRDETKPFHTIINSDNYYALQLLSYCYSKKVNVIYIDPPYNTGARDWKYNNDFVDVIDQFSHSKWLSMMKKRLSLAKELLHPDGVLICTIDDNEIFHLGCLIEEIFSEKKIFTIVIEHNKRGRQGEEFAKTHEYAIFVCPANKNVIEEQKLTSTVGGETRNLRRTGNGSSRSDRPKQFFPIYVDPVTKTIIEIGNPLPADEKRNDTPLPNGAIPIWPIDKDGIERRWYYSPIRIKKGIEEGKVFAAEQNYGIQIYYTLREKDTVRWKTVWSKPPLDASTYGSELLTDILGKSAKFSYPKSLYAVADCLMTTIASNKEALVLDFFAGSGTTYHATAFLNSEDDGNRRCILVTNNEVNEKTANELLSNGIYPGDPQFEKNGICESVTWPRCKIVTQGHRDDETPLSEMYLNGLEMETGFKENLAYFRLDFLDPHEVAVGEKFKSILPILWMMAGGKGELDFSEDSDKWFIPKKLPFAVLKKEKFFSQFRNEILNRLDISIVFFVTDSEEAYQEMSASIGKHIQTKMLYKNYLDNFKISPGRHL